MSPPKLRGGRLSSRPFYTTVLLLSVLTAYSFLAHTLHSRNGIDALDGDVHVRRSSDKPQCGQVHDADDKCAFVKKYCADDNAGLIAYTEFYYCGVGTARPVAFVLLVLWLGMLFTTIGIAASDFFSINLSTIATILGLSESLAGVTFLAFGNGSPDVFSTFAAMGSNSASMAVGELIGAASFITGVVAGSMALVREFKVDRKTYARDICFFIVAVAFTMVFLADGHLHFWECCVMIAYYVIYVITVVCWHWYSTRRKHRLRREGEARSHFYGTSGASGDELAGEPYRDDPDEVDQAQGRSRAGTAPADLSALEHGPRIEVEGRDPELADGETGSEEDHERMVAAEVASSMRVLRGRGKRSNTITPIRPSLVGALEFRSALAQLQRESNLQLSSIHGRSYSADHLNPQSRRDTTTGIASSTNPSRHTIAITEPSNTGRERALSSGDSPVSSTVHPDLLGARRGRDSTLSIPQSGGDRTPSPSPSYTVGGNLAPPPRGLSGSNDASSNEAQDDGLSPKLHLQIPSRRSSYSDRSSPNSPFPHYTDSPMVLTPNPNTDPSEFMLPPAAGSRGSQFADIQTPMETPWRPVSWWPYAVLPPPHILLTTMFPTLQGWRQKSHWDRFVSTISVPSIFLLVITLPVVESETSEETSFIDTVLDPPSPGELGHTAPPVSIQHQAMPREGEWDRYRRHTLSRNNSYRSVDHASPVLLSLEHEDTAVEPAEQLRTNSIPISGKPTSEIPSASNVNDETGWNRWLVCLQLFTGPLFSVFILWANLAEDWEDPGKALTLMILGTLLGSLVLLAILLLSTSENARPKYHYLFCFLGFIISIAWISTIAGEVVGVLKTFGVVLNISEALLGLTIFAAGNSVGDLIADITVARLGYPVMAL